MAHRCLAFKACVVSLGVWHVHMPSERFWLRPEPPGLAEILRAIPRRSLSASELEVLEADGVVVVPGLMRDAAALEALWEGALPRQFVVENNLWTYSGALRALARDGPFGALAASALGAESLRLLYGRFEWRLARPEPVPGKWHLDDHGPERKLPVVTVWVALTDAPDSLEFLPGSHRVDHNCVYSKEATDPHYADSVDQECMSHDFARNLSRERREPLPRSLSLSRGDAVVFLGQVWHRGLHQARERVAAVLRFLPADLPFAGALVRDNSWVTHMSFTPTECASLDGPLFPVVHPREQSTVDAEPWPLMPIRYDLHLRAWLGHHDVVRHRGWQDCSRSPVRPLVEAWRRTAEAFRAVLAGFPHHLTVTKCYSMGCIFYGDGKKL